MWDPQLLYVLLAARVELNITEQIVQPLLDANLAEMECYDPDSDDDTGEWPAQTQTAQEEAK